MKKFGNFFSVLLIVALSMILTAGCATSSENIPPLKNTTIHAEKTKLEISAPFLLRDDTVKGMEEVIPYLKNFIIKSNENDELMISACCYVYDNEAIEAQTGQFFTPDLEGALLVGVENMRNAAKNAIRAGAITDITVNGIRGKEINGSIDAPLIGKSQMVRQWDFRFMAFSEGVEMWAVMIIHKSSTEAKRISDAVFNSLKLSKN